MNQNAQESDQASATNGRAGREMTLVLAALALGAVLVLVASSREWVGLPDQASGGSGAEVAPAARALGLVGLAGVVLVPATRGIARRVAGVALALSGMGAGLATVLARPGAEVREAVPRATVGIGPWWALSLFGSVCLVIAGVVTLWRSGWWPAMGTRYDAPGAARRNDSWAMLDRGEDPTAQPERSGRED